MKIGLRRRIEIIEKLAKGRSALSAFAMMPNLMPLPGGGKYRSVSIEYELKPEIPNGSGKFMSCRLLRLEFLDEEKNWKLNLVVSIEKLEQKKVDYIVSQTPNTSSVTGVDQTCAFSEAYANSEGETYDPSVFEEKLAFLDESLEVLTHRTLRMRADPVIRGASVYDDIER